MNIVRGKIISSTGPQNQVIKQSNSKYVGLSNKRAMALLPFGPHKPAPAIQYYLRVER
jgi:hypothetical protein